MKQKVENLRALEKKGGLAIPGRWITKHKGARVRTTTNFRLQ